MRYVRCAPKRPVREQEGFTLIELIVGLAVLGMITAVIGSALNLGIVGTDRTANRISESRDLRGVEQAFTTALAQARPFRELDAPFPVVRFEGGPKTITFFADSPIGPQRHVFELSDEGELILRIGRTSVVTLLTDAEGSTFTFWGAKTPAQDEGWTDEWRGALEMPTLVRLHLPSGRLLVGRLRIEQPTL